MSGDEFDRLGDGFDRLGDEFDRLGSEFDHLAGATRPQTAADLDRLRTVARRRRTRSALTGTAAALLLVGGVGVTVLPRILGQSAGTGGTTTTAGAPLAAGATSDSAKTAGSDTPAASDSSASQRGITPDDGSARANGEPDYGEPDPDTGRGGPAPASGRGVVPVKPSTGGRLTATQTEALVAGWAAAYEARTSASDRVEESMPPVLHVDDVTRTLRGSAHTRLSMPLLITDLADVQLPAHPVGTRLILALDAENRLIAQYVVSGTVATQAWPTASRSTSVLVSDLESALS